MDQLLSISKDIRLVAIYDNVFKAKFQNGIIRYSQEEDIKLSLAEALGRWDYRKKMSFRIGDPKFAMAQYGKVIRITIPMGENGVMLITTELGIQIDELVDKILETRNRFFKTQIQG